MIPALNDIFYFTRETISQRFKKIETMALAYVGKTEDNQLRFNRIDWTSIIISLKQQTDPSFIISISIVSGSECIGFEIIKDESSLHAGMIGYFEDARPKLYSKDQQIKSNATAYKLVDEMAHAEKREEIIRMALNAAAKKVEPREVAA